MAKRIEWTDQGKADVRGIDQLTALRILRAIGRYALLGEGDVKKLQGIEPPELRLRVGDFRVRFYDHGEWMEILRVVNRRDAYR